MLCCFCRPPVTLAPITVTVNGRFVCEVFPAQKLPFTDADPAQLLAHLDGQRKHQQKIEKTICRINQSVAGILPPDATATEVSEKTQLRSHCYAAAIGEQTPPVPSNTLPLKIDGDRFGTGFDRYLSTAVSSRNRVIIRIETNTTEPVHPTSCTFTLV